MITLQDLFQYLTGYLSVEGFSDYGPNGVQVEGKEEIETIGFAVSASRMVIEQAVKEGVDALIVHHGLFWNRDEYPIVGAKREKIKALLDANISCLGYHLPLDAHKEVGNNWKVAMDLGWKGLTPFGEQGIGVRAEMEPISREELQKKLEEYYKHPAQVAFGGKKMIASAVVVSGGAHGMIKEVCADCLITGSFDEWVWRFAYEEGINFYALGHHATERIGVKALMEHLEKRFSIRGIWLEDDNPF